MVIAFETQPSFYCGDDVHQAKMDKVQRALRRRGLDALLLIKHDAVRYVTEFYAKGYRPFLDGRGGVLHAMSGFRDEPTHPGRRIRAERGDPGTRGDDTAARVRRDDHS